MCVKNVLARVPEHVSWVNHQWCVCGLLFVEDLPRTWRSELLLYTLLNVNSAVVVNLPATVVSLATSTIFFTQLSGCISLDFATFLLCDLLCQTVHAVGCALSFLFQYLHLLLSMFFIPAVGVCSSPLLGMLFSLRLGTFFRFCASLSVPLTSLVLMMNLTICWMSAWRLEHPLPELSLKLLMDLMPALFRARGAASAVTAPVVVTPCLRLPARDIDAASAVVAHDVRYRDQELSCPWRASRVHDSQAHVYLLLVGMVESPPSSQEQPTAFVARVMTPAIAYRDCLVKLLVHGFWVRIPPRFLVVAVVTASWLGAGWSVGTLDMSRFADAHGSFHYKSSKF